MLIIASFAPEVTKLSFSCDSTHRANLEQDEGEWPTSLASSSTTWRGGLAAPQVCEDVVATIPVQRKGPGGQVRRCHRRSRQLAPRDPLPR